MDYRVLPITRNDFKPWLLYKHYAHRIPSVCYAFGLYDKESILQGVCTFGIPASKDLCNFICGKEFNQQVLELNRLVVNESTIENKTSYFVSHCLKLIPKPRIIVSFADTGQNHQGYIYQATNFIFTGKTKPQKDLKVKGKNLHSRHAYDNPNLETERVERTIKSLYIFSWE